MKRRTQSPFAIDQGEDCPVGLELAHAILKDQLVGFTKTIDGLHENLITGDALFRGRTPEALISLHFRHGLSGQTQAADDEKDVDE